MPFHIQPITEGQIRDIVDWRYDPPYEDYNLASSPEKLPEIIAYFLNPALPCYAIMDADNDLLAFFTFGEDATVPGGDYSAEALDIGLGVRPDLTGKGLGSQFVTAVINFATATEQPQTLRVTIAEFNGRARRVWERQGFAIQQRFIATTRTKKPFAILTKELGVLRN